MSAISSPVMRLLISDIENNSHYSHWQALARSANDARHRGDESDASLHTHKASHIDGSCVREGIAIPLTSSSGERQSTTWRIRPSMIFSVSATRCLPKLPLSFSLRLQDTWDARGGTLRYYSKLITPALSPHCSCRCWRNSFTRFVFLGLANCSLTPLARTRREQMGQDYCITRNFSAGTQVLFACARVNKVLQS